MLSLSDSERVITWKTAVGVFLDNPILGVGPDGFQQAFADSAVTFTPGHVAGNAHNDFLQVLSTLGLVGFVAYLFLAVSVFKLISGPALGAITALFVNAKFNPVPLEAMVLAAVLIGGHKIKISGLGKSAFTLCSLALFSFISIISVADYKAQRDILSLKQACDLNPVELAHKEKFIIHGVNYFNKTNDIELKKVIAKEIHDEADEALRLRGAAAKHIVKFDQSIRGQGW